MAQLTNIPGFVVTHTGFDRQSINEALNQHEQRPLSITEVRAVNFITGEIIRGLSLDPRCLQKVPPKTDNLYEKCMMARCLLIKFMLEHTTIPLVVIGAFINGNYGTVLMCRNNLMEHFQEVDSFKNLYNNMRASLAQEGWILALENNMMALKNGDLTLYKSLQRGCGL